MMKDKQAQAAEIIKRLKKRYPDAHCALDHTSPFELLIATILSALPCFLGYLWPLWDAKKQTFHDKIVNTYSVTA